MHLHTQTLLRLTLLILLALSVSACEAIGTIFEAGVWVGLFLAVVIVALVAFIAAKLRGR